MEALRSLWTWMQGKKTYLGAIGYGVLGILWSEHVVTDDTAKLVGLLITGWTGYAVRDAISKSSNNAS